MEASKLDPDSTHTHTHTELSDPGKCLHLTQSLSFFICKMGCS